MGFFSEATAMADFTPPEGYVEGDFLSDFMCSRRSKRRQKYRHQKKKYDPTPFLSLPRSQRRDMTASLGWRIQSDPNGRGIFHTHGILPGSREWPLLDEAGQRNVSLWASFLFLSSAPLRQGRFFNATAYSVLHQAVDKLEELAEEAVVAQVQEEEKPLLECREFFQTYADGSVSTLSAPAAGLPSLGGLTKAGAQAAWLREHWEKLEELVSIAPTAELDFSYGHGIGVRFVVDQPWVDTETIPEIIEAFRQRGEQGYLDPPADLARYAKPLRELLESTLWRWDNAQAQAEGKPGPEPSDAVRRLYDFRSQAIRW